ALGAIRLRSDVERKRLFGEQQDADLGKLSAGIYTQDASAATYQRLHQLAEAALRAGFPVVIDATYLKQAQREAASQVAEACGAPFVILECCAPDEIIASWLDQRKAAGTDPSDATMEVVRAQQASREPLSAEELLLSKRVDTHESASLDTLIARIRQRLPNL
ncbi:MAG: ATP-binding protein, partial [Bacteroidetes bacterium]|nr:ATP-binding protein [Bacteroidota bacterium]